MKAAFRSKYVPPGVLSIQDIDKPTPTDPLDKIAEAFKYVATGQKTGNVIITMDEI